MPGRRILPELVSSKQNLAVGGCSARGHDRYVFGTLYSVDRESWVSLPGDPAPSSEAKEEVTI